MTEIIIVIGLPGSGKSTLLDHYKSHPFIDYKIYDDWLKVVFNECPNGSFESDIRYKDLVNDIDNKSHIILSTISFCDSEFLDVCIDKLVNISDMIKIRKIYFPNSPDICKNNVKYRDEKRGGKWVNTPNGDIYHGMIYNGSPLYLHEMDKIDELSKIYTIPDGAECYKLKKY